VQEATVQPAGSAIMILIPAGRYLLNRGPLTLTRNALTLVGAGAADTVLVGQRGRVVAVGPEAVAVLVGVTLAGGDAGSDAGGGLANEGRTILARSAVISDTATEGAGCTTRPPCSCCSSTAAS
jgi:hypothetical protein